MNKDFVLDFVAGGMIFPVHMRSVVTFTKNVVFKMFSCEGVSAAVSKTVVAPLERVKLLLQIQVNVCFTRSTYCIVILMNYRDKFRSLNLYMIVSSLFSSPRIDHAAKLNQTHPKSSFTIVFSVLS